MSTVEKPKNISESSSKAPSDTLLKNFRATLETRWNEFDRAIDQEYGFKAVLKGSDEDYKKAKATFDRAQAMLASKKTDTELSSDPEIIREVNSTIDVLTVYLRDTVKPDERNKSHNIILARTKADIADFKSKITGKVEDVEAAKIADKAEKDIPRAMVAATVAGTAGGLISSAEAKTLVDEGTKEAKKGFKSMIAEWLGFDKKTMIEDMAKRAKGESIGFMGTIRVMIFSLLNKVSFLGMTDDWTPEEMKLAGIASSISAGVPKPKEGAKQEIDTVKLENEENMKYRGASTAMRKLLYDKKTERAGIVFEHASFQKMTYGQLESVYREVSPSGKKEGISARLGLTPNTDEVVYEMLTGLCGGKLLSYIKQEYNKKYPQSRIEDISMKSLFVKIANEFGHIVTLRDLDITNPTSFLDGMSFDITADGELTGPVAEKVKSSVSKPILGYMLGDGAENKFTDLKSNLDNAKKRSPTLSEENLIEIEKIFAFGEAFQKKLLGDPKLHLGYADAFKTEFKDPGISFRSLVLLYGSLGGDTAFEQMTALGKLSFYSGVVMVAGGLDSMNRGGVATAFMKKLLGGENPEIDPEVRKLSEDAGVSLIGKAVGGVWETVKTIVGAGKESPMTAVGVVMALWFGGVAKKKWHSYRYH